LVIGTPERFGCAKQIASYVGVVPSEESSGDRRRLGHISKQGNVLLCFLLVEAAQVTVRSDPRWRSQFFHLAMRRGRKIAKVAMALDVAPRLGLRRNAKARFARGRARTSPWCAVNHRRNDWASRSPSLGSSKW
jgi:transposase